MQTRRELIVVLLVALIATFALWTAHALLHERIRHNQIAAHLQPLQAALPPKLREHATLERIGTLRDSEQLGLRQATEFFQIHVGAASIGWLIPVTAQDGYGGDIDLALAVSLHGEILGANVIHHHETAGIGDRIERRHSHWLDSFSGRSLVNPRVGAWFVKKDDGIFDQMTGATMTSRAATQAIRQALEYMRAHPEKFAEGAISSEDAHEQGE